MSAGESSKNEGAAAEHRKWPYIARLEGELRNFNDCQRSKEQSLFPAAVRLSSSLQSAVHWYVSEWMTHSDRVPSVDVLHRLTGRAKTAFEKLKSGISDSDRNLPAYASYIESTQRNLQMLDIIGGDGDNFEKRERLLIMMGASPALI